MSAQARTAEQRKERRRAILDAARALAADHGWAAVTTRRLSERITYSQPVLYAHFPGGKDAIVAAVALEGFAALAADLRQADGPDADEPAAPPARRRERVVAVAQAYLDFADEHAAIYDAMFTDRSELPFAADDTPAPLRDAFDALRGAVAPDPVLAEIAWATLHGLATLTRGGRLPAASARARVERLADLLV